MIKPLDSWETPHATDLGLNSLERLGAFFTGQIHDLNNQMAVLSNAELLLPQNEPFSREIEQYLQRLFASIHRISATCERFNVVRKAYPVEIERISLREAWESITGAVADCTGWNARGTVAGEWKVLLNPSWLPLVIAELIAHLESPHGVVEISLGEPPPRQYKHSLRTSFNDGPDYALLVHFKGDAGSGEVATSGENFEIALELIRLLGAGISLGRSDSAKDCLLAIRLQQ